jgi:hypothetical protein
MSNQRDIILGGLIVVSFASIGLMFRGDDKPSRKNPRGRKVPTALILKRDLVNKDFASFHDLADRYGISIAELFHLFKDFDIDIENVDLSTPQDDGHGLAKRQQLLGMHSGPLDDAMKRKLSNRVSSKPIAVEKTSNKQQQTFLGGHSGPLDDAMEKKFSSRASSKTSVVNTTPNRLQLERDFALGLGASKIATKYNKTIPEIQQLVVAYQIRYVGDIN